MCFISQSLASRSVLPTAALCGFLRQVVPEAFRIPPCQTSKSSGHLAGVLMHGWLPAPYCEPGTSPSPNKLQAMDSLNRVSVWNRLLLTCYMADLSGSCCCTHAWSWPECASPLARLLHRCKPLQKRVVVFPKSSPAVICNFGSG